MKALQLAVYVAVVAFCVGYSLQQSPCEEQTDVPSQATVNTNQAGQWFTAACAGPLGNFVVPLRGTHSGGTTQMEARLYSGRNWPASAGSVNGLGVATASINNGDSSFTLDFSSTGATLSLGGEYTVRLVRVSGPPARVGSSTADPYANGEFLSATDTTSTGTTFATFDMAFQYFLAAASPPAVAQGDPHLVGLHGQHYDFIGKTNTVFNLLTSQLVQVNSLFTMMEIIPNFFDGTYLQTISIQAHGALPRPIVIDAGNSSFVDQPSLRFGVGENAVEFEAPQPNNNNNDTRRNSNVLLKTENVEVTWAATETTATALGIADNHNDRVIRVATVTITKVAMIEVFCIENGYRMHLNGRVHQNTPTARRNLDIRVRVLNNNMNVHGVIGATNDATVARPPGKDEDYEVKDGLLGNDFIHNLYPRNKTDRS